MSLVLTTRYLGNFSDEKILTQIYAANAIMIVGISLGIISFTLICYMKTRLGLKPEEYDKTEIYS